MTCEYRYKPLLTTVLISVDKMEDEKSKGGIIVGVTEREKNEKAIGTVLDLGPNAFSEYGGVDYQDIKIGDKILFIRYAGIKIISESNEKKEIRLMHDKDIVCKLEEVKV